MKNIAKIAVLSACLITQFCLAQDAESFSVIKTCSQDICSVYRIFEDNSKKIVKFDANKISDIKKIDDNLYYFHISCGSPCGYGHYITSKDLFLTKDNEVLFDKNRKCIIYADWNDHKIFSRILSDKKPLNKLIYNFSNIAKYKDNEDYQELLDSEPLHQIFKEDAFIDNKGILHLYAFGKKSNLITLEIKDACES
ncbi:hypothetical protein [Psychrobacter immobilis]|uniref:hypothetical protein n=1 Tax=Psychrobacter immobilis TaxID=498 RepID=UPI0019186909|nr:hypothetical protein [Psychrobacter immobilis]